MAVEFKDNSKQVLDQMNGNIKRALTAMGEVGLEMIINTMNTGYDRKIYQTGTLQRDQVYRVDEKEQSTSWGVLQGAASAPYAVYVHEGTRKMAKRPWLNDAILGHKRELQETAQMYIKEGFDK